MLLLLGSANCKEQSRRDWQRGAKSVLLSSQCRPALIQFTSKLPGC